MIAKSWRNNQTYSMVFCNLGRVGANGMAFKTFELYQTKDLSMQSVQTSRDPLQFCYSTQL